MWLHRDEMEGCVQSWRCSIACNWLRFRAIFEDTKECHLTTCRKCGWQGTHFESGHSGEMVL